MVTQFYTIEQICKITGLSKSTVYKLTANRVVSFYKPFGKKIYFSPEQLEAMLTKVRVKSLDEINAEVNSKGGKL